MQTPRATQNIMSPGHSRRSTPVCTGTEGTITHHSAPHTVGLPVFVLAVTFRQTRYTTCLGGQHHCINATTSQTSSSLHLIITNGRP